MFLRLVLTASFLLPLALKAQDLNLVLKGDKEQVLAVVKRAIDEEMSNAIGGTQPVAVNGRQGYALNYRSFLTGPSGFAAFIYPMAFEDEWTVSAYMVGFETKSSIGSNKGLIKDVIDRLQKADLGAVELVADRTNYRPLGPQSQRCVEKMASDPKLALLSSKVQLFYPDRATLIQLSDESKPSAEEAKQIAAWSAMRDICFNLVKINMSFYPADPRMALQIQGKESTDALLLALYKGSLTYGQFNSQRKQSANNVIQNQINSTVEINRQNAQNAAQNAEKQAAFELERQRVQAEQMKAQALQTQANKPNPISPSLSITCRTNSMGYGSSTTQCD